MLSWGSMSVRIAIRRLNARERSNLYEPHLGQPLCTLSLAGEPGDNTWICIIDAAGGYECPLVTSDGMPPLRNANGATNRLGTLTLNVPARGHARDAAALVATALPARRRLHPAVDPRRRAAPRAEVRRGRRSALSRALLPRLAANRRKGRAPLRLGRPVRSVLRACRPVGPSRRDHRVRLPRRHDLQPLRDHANLAPRMPALPAFAYNQLRQQNPRQSIMARRRRAGFLRG
jgi:hypothetical protein